ncbi:hypothetical protein PWT90_10406 [Aphanocladium album]|nr:hypothetical protein PWT90_10406 [Aphanocladium album]
MDGQMLDKWLAGWRAFTVGDQWSMVSEPTRSRHADNATFGQPCGAAEVGSLGQTGSENTQRAPWRLSHRGVILRHSSPKADPASHRACSGMHGDAWPALARPGHLVWLNLGSHSHRVSPAGLACPGLPFAWRLALPRKQLPKVISGYLAPRDSPARLHFPNMRLPHPGQCDRAADAELRRAALVICVARDRLEICLGS